MLVQNPNFAKADDEIASMRRHCNFLRWDREANGRLYYGFWIIFVGGFLLSFNSSFLPSQTSPCAVAGLHAFRFLALLGSVINFFLQSFAIDSARFANQELIMYESHRRLVSPLPADSQMSYKKALELGRKKEKLDSVCKVLGQVLIYSVVVFLALALLLSWDAIPPSASGKLNLMKSKTMISVEHNPGDPPLKTDNDWAAVETLAMTQEAFAAAYRIPVGTLRDWNRAASAQTRPPAPISPSSRATPKP